MIVINSGIKPLLMVSPIGVLPFNMNQWMPPILFTRLSFIDFVQYKVKPVIFKLKLFTWLTVFSFKDFMNFRKQISVSPVGNQQTNTKGFMCAHIPKSELVDTHRVVFDNADLPINKLICLLQSYCFFGNPVRLISFRICPQSCCKCPCGKKGHNPIGSTTPSHISSFLRRIRRLVCVAASSLRRRKGLILNHRSSK